MNQKPDNATITRWIDGELQGEELNQVEKWVELHPELLEERELAHTLSSMIKEEIPQSIDPPSPEFFTYRVMHQIETLEKDSSQHSSRDTNQHTSQPSRFWQWIFAPVSLAAMALCFYLGTLVDSSSQPQLASSTPTNQKQILPPANTLPSVYTPDEVVSADIIRAPKTGTTVILLEGLTDFPDNMEMVGAPIRDASKGMMIQSEKDTPNKKYTY